MKRVRLTSKIDAWGQKWPKGTVLAVHKERRTLCPHCEARCSEAWANHFGCAGDITGWEVVFPVNNVHAIGTITKRDAEEIE